MELFIMKIACPKCGSDTFMRGCFVNGVEIPELPDIPWINETDPSKNKKRFDMCTNRHHFNIRPFIDDDLHYVYEDKLDEAETITRERLFAILKLKGDIDGNNKNMQKTTKERVSAKQRERPAAKHIGRGRNSGT
jgi:hypothetical protein